MSYGCWRNMPVTIARIDQKLIHGQVTAAWVPHLSIEEIIVVDEEITEDHLTQSIMASGLPPQVGEIFFTHPSELPGLLESHASKRLMVIFRDVPSVSEAIELGVKLSSLNLGNQAYLPNTECLKLTECFFANRQDMAALSELVLSGLDLFFQSVPTDRRVSFNPASFKWP
jgi:mannose/fructose/N-acetylgalactosamine-specific phosphotransferase system component IIB